MNSAGREGGGGRGCLVEQQQKAKNFLSNYLFGNYLCNFFPFSLLLGAWLDFFFLLTGGNLGNNQLRRFLSDFYIKRKDQTYGPNGPVDVVNA